MEQVRIAKQSDQKAYRDLWQICFGDSDAFCQWFFIHRFCPSYSVCLELDGILPSAMQAFPYDILIRGKRIEGAMLCGVCTHPQYRKRGYMGRMFSYNMKVLRQHQKAVAVHTPAVLESYFSFGHETVADACYLTAEKLPVTQKKELIFLEGEERKNAFACYDKFARKYSGIVLRGVDDFIRKMDDYSADGGRIVVDRKDSPSAYACFYLTQDELTCVEAAGETEALQTLLEDLLTLGGGRKCSVKLPPDTDVTLSCCEKKILPKGVMGLANISLLLERLGLESESSFCLRDTVIEENNGCFDLSGKNSQKPPSFVISAGKLLPVLVGYRSLEEQRPWIEVKDEKGFREIAEALPKVPCYIIDEY
ncbi:GNAT family N-acetyltransferase [Anaerotignum lactatifermentans]|uniref:GNAT family N-acetyltransferase n=1 Tax=Anaerotignum lactatifermentans TaxID=160404 RepID=A0ABS2G989_9FIRM|nr:GNAT family N-acetyltransferase [Anaerotignum lactatifermentans]MBM6828574.1 GNAT family N-acetyltransferase [Anaerotignum lactatifermentans]MBM6877981.1 GNAT family N-acetyltransferase [Anaerotignum lactatifermentans]MBM6950156.1 GNAT family N-acetyltransferase [Anaerotignum lactatifermentans]